GGAGVASTEYRVNGGDWLTYDGPITFPTGGSYVVGYRSVDRDANVEGAKSIDVTVRYPGGCGERGTVEGNNGRPGCGNVEGSPNAGNPGTAGKPDEGQLCAVRTAPVAFV